MPTHHDANLTAPLSALRLRTVRQRFPETAALDLPTTLRRQLAKLPLRPGLRVAVGVGSRGISNLAAIVGTLLHALQDAGCLPFIVPAMGSHGGGTPAGQLVLLAEYGVTEATLGVPIRAEMDVASLGVTPDGTEVLFSRAALEADAVLPVNRIKPHTDFGGSLGSGLLKMLVVGFGKRDGAALYHQAASRFGYARALLQAAALVPTRVPVLGGVAILEDQRHQTARLEVVPAGALPTREEALCAEARALMPRLPFDDLDLLIVDRLGKNISGTGMDPNVIGRSIHGYSLQLDPAQPPPRIRRIFVRDLTPESHGNAIGLGMADFTTTRLVQALDREVTMLNSLTALSLQGAKVPLHFASDHDALTQALHTLALPHPHQARVARIADTLALERLAVSDSLWASAANRTDLVGESEPAPLEFDAAGNLAAG